jgi:hypothetical protein
MAGKSVVIGIAKILEDYPQVDPGFMEEYRDDEVEHILCGHRMRPPPWTHASAAPLPQV